MESHLYNIPRKLNADSNIKAISEALKGLVFFPLLMPFLTGFVQIRQVNQRSGKTATLDNPPSLTWQRLGQYYLFSDNQMANM